MKKRLITILSLVMAVVLCFSLAACGGGDNKPQTSKTVSISLSDALDAADGVMSAKGFTGTASYTVSTKNTQALTENVTLDKRGNKLKVASKNNETIIDLQTGYVYYKYGDCYAFDNEFYANAYGYAQYLIASLKKQAQPDQKCDARYDAKTKTVKFTFEHADGVNKYIAPLQKMYKKEKYKVGDLLDEYCNMLLGKDFDDIYGELEDYVSDPKNTVGTLLAKLKAKGLDVEALLEMFGYSLPEAQMTAIKARPLNKVVAGAYAYIKDNIKNMLPFAIDEAGGETDNDNDDLDSEQGGGMMSMGMALIQAMLFEEVSEQEVAAALSGMREGIAFVKNTFTVKSVVDMVLANNAEAADLYTVIREGVKLKNATATLTLTVGDNKTINGVKIDNFVSHTYTGKAAEGSYLADNDYRATAEIKIDEYTTPTEGFVITCDPACDYKMPIVSYLYEVTGKDVSVYFETGGNTVTVTEYALFWNTPDGDRRQILSEDENAFKFDAATSSFVFDKGLIHDAFSDEAFASYMNAGFSVFGTSLEAVVFFDDDEGGYAIQLMYVNDDLNELSDFLCGIAVDKILSFVDGAGSGPNIGEVSTVDGKYCYVKSDNEIDMENNYFIIDNGEIIECFIHGDDVTDSAVLSINGSDVEILITFPASGEDEEYTLLLCGTVYSGYINITTQYAVVDGELADSIECDDIYAKISVED